MSLWRFWLCDYKCRLWRRQVEILKSKQEGYLFPSLFWLEYIIALRGSCCDLTATVSPPSCLPFWLFLKSDYKVMTFIMAFAYVYVIVYSRYSSWLLPRPSPNPPRWSLLPSHGPLIFFHVTWIPSSSAFSFFPPSLKISFFSGSPFCSLPSLG